MGGVILHGLTSFGYAAKAVVRSIRRAGVEGDLQYFGGRFTSPVRPGGRLRCFLIILTRIALLYRG
jgi:peroxisomal enoyl-CoA hydratase 2